MDIEKFIKDSYKSLKQAKEIQRVWGRVSEHEEGFLTAFRYLNMVIDQYNGNSQELNN